MSELLKAGRELDALVAEKVMGFWYEDDHWWTRHQDGGSRAYATAYLHIWGPNYGPNGLPYFSTDIAAAWEVVEKLLATHAVNVNAIPGASVIQWGATVQRMPYVERHPEHGACATTAPLAICLAALEAVRARPTEQETR